MPRPATGQIIRRETQDTAAWTIRYRANGYRVREVVGHEPATTQRDAERALKARLSEVKAGIWKHPKDTEALREVERLSRRLHVLAPTRPHSGANPDIAAAFAAIRVACQKSAAAQMVGKRPGRLIGIALDHLYEAEDMIRMALHEDNTQ